MTNRLLAAVSAAVAALLTSSSHGQTCFVLDSVSPSLTSTADIRIDSPGPTPVAPGTALAWFQLGLVPMDRITAISAGDDPVSELIHGPTDHLFSVTRQSIGLPGTGVSIERIMDTPPPGPPAPGHPADIFYWEHFVVANNILAPAGMGWRAGTTDGDEANARLLSAIGMGDNLNGLELTDLSSPVLPPFEVYFSLTPGSPTALGLGASGGDILAVGGAFGAAPVIFAPAFSIGIPAGVGVNMNALILEVELTPFPVLVAAEYAVTSASATGFALTGSGDIVNSGADLIQFEGGVAVVTHRPVDLGLLAVDDIDALEALLPRCPADLNHDGIVDFGDLLLVLSAWGPCGGCLEDLDRDGNVDFLDLLIVLSSWGPC